VQFRLFDFSTGFPVSTPFSGSIEAWLRFADIRYRAGRVGQQFFTSTICRVDVGQDKRPGVRPEPELLRPFEALLCAIVGAELPGGSVQPNR